MMDFIPAKGKWKLWAEHFGCVVVTFFIYLRGIQGFIVKALQTDIRYLVYSLIIVLKMTVVSPFSVLNLE